MSDRKQRTKAVIAAAKAIVENAQFFIADSGQYNWRGHNNYMVALRRALQELYDLQVSKKGVTRND